MAHDRALRSTRRHVRSSVRRSPLTVRSSREEREWAAAALIDLAQDTTAAPAERREAAWQVAGLGGEHREQALDALADLAADPTVDTDDRLEAVWHLARSPQRWGEALRLLDALATDPTVEDPVRVAAADRLGRFGADHRERASSLLRSLADCPSLASGERALAAQPGTDTWVRQWAAEDLARMRTAGLTDTVHSLVTIGDGARATRSTQYADRCTQPALMRT